MPPFNWNFGPNSTSSHERAPDLGERFEVREVLGRGAMGVVYRGFDRQLGREVAIKAIAPGARGAALERMWREARAGAALRHPGIVGVHECLELASGPCMVQELLDDARPLSEVLSSATPLAKRLELVLQVASAVAHAHDRGVVHRDLKPGNVLVDRDGRARVADFGLAWHDGADTLTATGAAVGTPHYMAPEQLGVVQASSREPAADVWALGVILFEAIGLRLPFQGRTFVEQMALVSAAPPPPSRIEPGVSAAVEAVCLKALQLQPGARHEDAGSLAKELEGALRGEGAPRRRSPLVPLTAAFVALGFAAGAFALTRDRRERAPAPVPPVVQAQAPPAPDPPVALGWALKEGQEWSTTYGYHAEEEWDRGASSSFDMQYFLRLRVVSIAGASATLTANVERIRFALRDGNVSPIAGDSLATVTLPGANRVRVDLPRDARLTLRLQLPAGRVESVRGASALKSRLMERANDLDAVFLESALLDLDDVLLAECLSLVLAPFPASEGSEAHWDRVVKAHPGRDYSLSAVLRTRRDGHDALAWSHTEVIQADPRLTLTSLLGSSRLKPGGLVESRADLDMRVTYGGEGKRCKLSFLLGGDRLPPLATLSKPR